jgi:hypothetical protein
MKLLIVKKSLEKLQLLVEHLETIGYYESLGRERTGYGKGYRYTDYYVPEQEICKIMQITRQALRYWYERGMIAKTKEGTRGTPYYQVGSIIYFLLHQPAVREHRNLILKNGGSKDGPGHNNHYLKIFELTQKFG